MSVQHPGAGKVEVIMDLEYAVLADDTNLPRDARMGTHPFMPLEVMDNLSSNIGAVEKRSRCYVSDTGDLVCANISPQSCTAAPFCANTFHDVESVWWIVVWFLFAFVPKGYRPLSSHYKAYHTLFPGPGSSHASWATAWIDKTEMAARLSCVPPACRQCIDLLADAQNDLRLMKIEAYGAPDAFRDPEVLKKAAGEATRYLVAAMSLLALRVDGGELVPMLSHSEDVEGYGYLHLPSTDIH